MMYTNQHTLTQGQAGSLGKLHNHTMLCQKPECAWCLAEQGLEPGNGSHGICVQHAAGLLQQWRERHASRS